jgi:hypothetical protein
MKTGSLLVIIKDTERQTMKLIDAFNIVSNISQTRMTAVNIRGL